MIENTNKTSIDKLYYFSHTERNQQVALDQTIHSPVNNAPTESPHVSTICYLG